MKLKLNFVRRLPRLALLACVLGIFMQAAAQQAVTSATLSGRLEDANGAGVSGAVVAAMNTETNISTSTTSDQAGRFYLRNLPAGTYVLKIEQAGFAPVSEKLTLTVGQTLDL